MPDEIPTSLVIGVVTALAGSVVFLYNTIVKSYEREITTLRNQLDRSNTIAEKLADRFDDSVQVNRRMASTIERTQSGGTS